MERFKLWATVRMSLKQKLAFTKYLAVLLRSGLAIDEVLVILGDQSKGAIKHIVSALSYAVQNGDRLADGFAKFPHLFNPVFINLVAAGEASGSLNTNLEHLAEQQQKDHELRQKIKGAVMYPLIILSFAIILCIGIVVFILPNVTDVFESLDVQLPITTRILLWVADLVEQRGDVLAIIGVAGVVTILVLRQLNFVKPFTHTALLYMPVIGGIAKKTNLARLMRLMGTMLKSGMTIDEVLPLSRNVLSNVRYRQALKQVQIEVGQGNTLAAAFGNHKTLFSPLFLRMTRVGEESGTLGSTFLYLTEFYEGEINDETKNLSTLLEPFLLVLIGLMVGTVALSIISPIYGIVGSV